VSFLFDGRGPFGAPSGQAARRCWRKSILRSLSDAASASVRDDTREHYKTITKTGVDTGRYTIFLI